MDKKYAFIFALLLAGLIACNVFLLNFVSTQSSSTREPVVISRIVDGDTLKLEDGRTLRLLNINSPEKGAIGANLASEFLENFENKTVWIEITGTDKYRRSLARIYAPDYLNLKIVELGLASKFLVQNSELSDFAKAEEKAIKNNLGIWKKSDFSGCFGSKIYERDELVFLANKCSPINMNGWFLKDESRKIYTFTNTEFEKLTLHSGKGIDNLTDIFWQSETDIWNNDRDTLYLFDSEGGIAHYESYGY